MLPEPEVKEEDEDAEKERNVHEDGRDPREQVVLPEREMPSEVMQNGGSSRDDTAEAAAFLLMLRR